MDNFLREIALENDLKIIALTKIYLKMNGKGDLLDDEYIHIKKTYKGTEVLKIVIESAKAHILINEDVFEITERSVY